MPLGVYERLPDGGQLAAPDHYLDNLIHNQPNFTDTAVDFWQQMLWHAILRGTAYAEIKSTPTKPVAALLPLHPDRVKPEKLSSGRWRFKVRDDNGTERVLLDSSVFRFSGLVAGGIEGMGLATYAGEAIAIGVAADQYASRVFSNMLNAGVILTHPLKISEQAQNNLVKSFMKRLAGVANAHRPILLQEGIKAERGFSQTAEEAQLLDARKWQTLEVCRALDMPPIMVGINEGALGANVEEQSLNFVRYTLMPWAKRIEQAIRRDLIAAERDGSVKYKAEFNFQGLLRGNATARADYFSKALGSGGSPAWMSVNEVRALDGLNRYDDPLFDKPALGTNPKQTPDVGQPADPATTNQQQSAALVAPLAKFVKKAPETYAERCAALIAKEVKLLRKYAELHGADISGWRVAVGSFYRSHVSTVMTLMKVPKDKARIYCLAREARFAAANDILGAIDALENHGLAELVGKES
jgi:hypothetical protein